MASTKTINFDEIWKILQETVKCVISLRAVDRQMWYNSFADVFSLCVAVPETYADRLYNETVAYLEEHVKQLQKDVVTSEEGLVAAYHEKWMQYSSGIVYLNELYKHLNNHCSRTFIATHKSGGFYRKPISDIKELGLLLWKKYMIKDLKESLVPLLLHGILSNRLGFCPYQPIYAAVIQSFVQVEECNENNLLKLYKRVFERSYLENTSHYYKLETNTLLLGNDCSSYMEKMHQRLLEEDLRNLNYLHPSSFSKVKQVCEARMAADHVGFLHGGCAEIVSKEHEIDMNRMFVLLRTVPSGINVLVEVFRVHVTKVGLHLLCNLKGDNIHLAYVENLLKVHVKYSKMVKDLFLDDLQFTLALNKALNDIVLNEEVKQVGRAPQLLAKYCDALLKKNTIGYPESEREDRLTLCVTLFKYINDKDVFQEFYSRMLCKRLIQSQSMSMEAEEMMINKLKQMCGYEFTSKFHRIFTDMNVSGDINNRFGAHLRDSNVELGFHFNVSIIQVGAWPFTQTAVPLFSIPHEIEKCVQEFESFYRVQFKGRKLMWLHQLCNADLKLCYLKTSYTVTLSTYQMAVLIMYESDDRVSFRELQESTQLNDDNLEKQIQSLITAKLLLHDEGTEISQSSFSLNKNYSNKRIRFKITPVSPKEALEKEDRKAHSSIEKDRKLYLNAAIVRVMKARKVLKHNALIEEVINQAKELFSPDISTIKKCIESLIEKQYLERCPDSNAEYRYVA